MMISMFHPESIIALVLIGTNTPVPFTWLSQASRCPVGFTRQRTQSPDDILLQYSTSPEHGFKIVTEPWEKAKK